MMAPFAADRTITSSNSIRCDMVANTATSFYVPAPIELIHFETFRCPDVFTLRQIL